ncbi:MAG: DUF2271 domain-containing protein [Marinobacter sp.]|uniref:DUF2271 domain-containing protein n=1 Tax=Marinobacter sp. TaxID=50741 RepID=UPI003F99E051
MKLTGKIPALALLLGSACAGAGELALKVEIPALNVAEYHKPYVAIWIEDSKGRHQQNISLWYDHDMRDDEGSKWLKDLRLWWRRSGRQLSLPVDGFSGATRPVGTHELVFNSLSPAIRDLPKGDYRLVVEAAREVGGRELLKLPFQWPAESTYETSQQGSSELGRIYLTIQP